MPKIKIDKEINLDEVLKFATLKHKNQKRDDGKDYIIHPIRVAKIIDEYKAEFSVNRNVLLAGALLHDTLEDTYTSYHELVEKFGEVVASLVLELTTAKYACNYIGKAQYLAEKMQHMTNYALTIKLADRLDNVRDLGGCKADKRKKILKDTVYILNYLQKNRELTSTQISLCAAIKEAMKQYE